MRNIIVDKVTEHMSTDNLPSPKKFTDTLTTDHEIINNYESFKDNRMTLIIQDHFTYWIQGYSSKNEKYRRYKETVSMIFRSS